MAFLSAQRCLIVILTSLVTSIFLHFVYKLDLSAQGVGVPYVSCHVDQQSLQSTNSQSPSFNNPSSKMLESPGSSLVDISIETTIPGGAHIHGFTVFDRLYVRNGTFYVLTSNSSSFPPKRNIISRPLDKGKSFDLEPTDQDLQFINALEAKDILGDKAIIVRDMSMIYYDPSQFMHHFYHWWGEIILGSWRVYSHLKETEPDSVLSRPARFILPVIENGAWRDRAGVDGPLMRAAFPDASINEADYWKDLMELDKTVVFERALISNRESAHRHPWGGRWFKMIAGTMNITVPPDFWKPIRESVIENIVGFVPKMDQQGVIIDPPQALTQRPLVTYISRQGAGRRLTAPDHEGLVSALKMLESEGICDVRVALMERMSLREQIEMVSKSTIIVGVHGNGLTHQIWMPPSDRSTVIEIFHPPAYVFDYELLTRNMGHRHYAVWNDTLLTYPSGSYYKGIDYGKDFHGNNIPVYGPAVADVIRERLTGNVS